LWDATKHKKLVFPDSDPAKGPSITKALLCSFKVRTL
jgi:hypothetical protein